MGKISKTARASMRGKVVEEVVQTCPYCGPFVKMEATKVVRRSPGLVKGMYWVCPQCDIHVAIH